MSSESEEKNPAFHVEIVSTSAYQMALAYVRTNNPEDVVLFGVNTPWLGAVLTGESGSKIKPTTKEFLHKLEMDFERYSPEFFFFIVPQVEDAKLLREAILEQLPQELRDQTDLNMHIWDKGEVIFV